MAATGARLRLTVQVLPLEAEHAHGPHRAQAVALSKGRKFALPVQSEDTFEQVWTRIEQRYKANYLNAQQAATFTIKKLQDAYDCDLDVGDTVSSIFEGETDPAMRTIKVVPSFVNRNFSVPPTSNLRPGHAQKRLRELNVGQASKRRRVEQPQLEDMQQAGDLSRDQPIPTTESERNVDGGAGQGGLRAGRLRRRPRSRQTGESCVIVKDAQTGHVEFGPRIKSESQKPETPGAAVSQRKDIYEVPSSPEEGIPSAQAIVTPRSRAGRRPKQKRGGGRPPKSTGSVSQHTSLATSTPNVFSQTAPPNSIGEADTSNEVGEAIAITSGEASTSRSASAAHSTKTSPAMIRPPARFLSHSPTPEVSGSENESEHASGVSDSEDEHVEMPEVPVEPTVEDAPVEPTLEDLPTAPTFEDVSAEPTLDVTIDQTEDAIPSSPPHLPDMLNPTLLAPETSQPLPSQVQPTAIRKTPVPLPPPSQPRSSQSVQSVSAQAAARRPAARYSGFRSLREQLVEATTKPTTPQTKSYDPRTLDLGKLAAKAKGGSNRVVSAGDGDDSSEDEESSSSSDSD
ncbi:hypothetical protein N0V83_004890 [Neocucurbitaria cava]|uniref:Nucleolar protein Dnt1-like N-terminal domain-containing protein n=1 Tax=Neocucurbitaria cava TaxID=798079 RepID=A0A9W8Y824_9PLEO|nr:hypothetical protein N0V83_004890 [Neocucurbitaria cava]